MNHKSDVLGHLVDRSKHLRAFFEQTMKMNRWCARIQHKLTNLTHQLIQASQAGRQKISDELGSAIDIYLRGTGTTSSDDTTSYTTWLKG